MQEDIFTQLLIIIFTPFALILLFQLSSYLNMTFLSTGIALIEIEDFAELVGISEDRIRMFPLKSEHVKFKVLDQDKKNYISETVFDLEKFKVIETNLEINEPKFFELKRKKFSQIIRVDSNLIKISEDGNTFSQIEIDKDGNESIVGLVTFDVEGNPTEIQGKFKKFF